MKNTNAFLHSPDRVGKCVATGYLSQTFGVCSRRLFWLNMSSSPPSRPKRGPSKKGAASKGAPPRKPPQRGKKKNAKNKSAVEAALAAIEASDIVGQAKSDDPLKQEWVFKDGEILKGPVVGDVIASHARDGTLDKECPVGHEVGEWRPLKSVPAFYKALKEGQAEREEVARQKRFEAKERSNSRMRVMLMVAIFMVPFLVSAVATRAVIAVKPWDDSKKWVDKTPPIIDLPAQKEAPPKVALVEPKKLPMPELEPIVHEPDDASEPAKAEPTNKSNRKKGRGRKGKKNKKGKTSKKNVKSKNVKENKQTKVASAKALSGNNGKLRSLSKKQILSGLGKGKKGIGGCLRTEFKRNKSMPKTVTLGFVVANDGKAIQIVIKERQLRKGPLVKCLRRTLGRLKWPVFYGERKYTEVPFKIGR